MRPGMRKIMTGMTLRAAPQIVPRRAIVRFLAASVRCTMYWSVHQYQIPMIGEAMQMASHGKSLSDSGCQRAYWEACVAVKSRSPLQPPSSLDRPK